MRVALNFTRNIGDVSESSSADNQGEMKGQYHEGKIEGIDLFEKVYALGITLFPLPSAGKLKLSTLET